VNEEIFVTDNKISAFLFSQRLQVTALTAKNILFAYSQLIFSVGQRLISYYQIAINLLRSSAS
jgi:hypothetical protein